MADATATTDTDAAAQTSSDSTDATATATTADMGDSAATGATTSDDGAAALGDAGKKALDAMKAKWKDADKLAKENAAALAALQAKLDGKEAEHAADQAKREAEQSALADYNKKLLRLEVKAAAKGVLNDPADAYKFLDLDSIEVDEDGNVDEAAVAKALADLVAEKPYLSAQGGQRFQGTADGGARKEAGKPSQLSKADVERLSKERKYAEIEQARQEGRLADYLGS